MDLTINPIYKGLYERHRFKIMHGGRSSGKSWGAVQYLVVRALQRPTRILCCREYQGSIRESVHKLLVDTIYRLGVENSFDVTYNTIRCKNGSDFIFAGLFNNVDSIKSTEGVDICHVEEAHNVSQTSWDVLLPTIRKAGSEFVIVFNPRSVDDATWTNFVSNPMPDSWVKKIDYMDNPHNSDEIIAMAEHSKANDIDAYNHIWLGEPLSFTKQQIFADKLSIEEFDWKSMRVQDTYYGIDWGYSNDPTAMVRCHIANSCLYVSGEAGSPGIEISDIGDLIKQTFPELGAKRMWADCSLPSVISHVQRLGGITGLRGAKKWSGSIEDGIMVMRGFNKIVVHPDCANVIYEMKNYKWKLDTNQEITSKPMDKDNHYCDAIRYAIGTVIESMNSIQQDPWGFNK